MRRAKIRAWAAPTLCLAVPLMIGCGPIEYVANSTMAASGAVAEAKNMKSDKFAPYEITAAQEYLHKSRELAGFARFQVSVTYARKATKLAKEARTITLEKAALPEAQREAAAAPSTKDQP